MEPTLFQNFTNQYAVSKTLRFGMTIKQSDKKNPSHQMFADLIRVSEERIKQSVPSKLAHDDATLVNDASRCIIGIKKYLQSWQDIYRRSDQVAVTKEYYRRLTRKACFDGFWQDDKRGKQPQSQIIKISSLKKKQDGKEIKDYILDYWANNLDNAKQKIHDIEPILEQYQTALNRPDMAHTKPRLVDFRKMFLSLVALCEDTLTPVNNESICFPDLGKLSVCERNISLINFTSQESKEEREGLAEQIMSIRDYFKDNGGYAPYGKVTLNPYTAMQKPQNYRQEIDDILHKLKLSDLIKRLIDHRDTRAYFEFKGEDKKSMMNDNRRSIVESVQAFKYKPIPTSVRFMLADYLSRYHALDKDKINILFERIGESRTIGQEYTTLKDKIDFSLLKYPLKAAFDYAWENIARSVHNAVDCPEKQCAQFLKDMFDVDVTTPSFKLYADLFFIKESLTTLEHDENGPREREKFVANIQRTFQQIKFTDKADENLRHQKAILAWIGKDVKEQRDLKAKNDSLFTKYETAKEKLGLLRGRQKNNIKSYKEMTEAFKKLSGIYGRNFADLREKLREESELNKISHFGAIVEDSNQDRYVLMMPLLDKNRETDQIDLIKDEKDGDLKTYRVKSLTSKTLEKLIKNAGAYKDFHINRKKPDPDRMKRDWTNYKDTPDFLEYVKRCLQESQMAASQNWAEFGCDFSRCNSYEDIEHELDSRAYRFEQGRLTNATLTRLINQENCLLLPFVNQDITSKERLLKNRFSKDWALIFEDENNYRLHPEFRIVCRHPTPDYPANKRYSRFQMIAHMLCEYIPKSKEYLSRKEQIRIFNDKDEQKRQVDAFNENLKPLGEFYVFGIDRGLRQLATLCILNQDGQIQGGFEIYTRSFDPDKKQWLHTKHDTRAILDLSNLRVETTISGEKVLVDQATIGIKVRDKNGNATGEIKDNQQKIKLKQLSYIRKLQHRMQYAEDKVILFCKQHTTLDAIADHIGELITPYKEGPRFADLPKEKISDMLTQYMVYAGKTDVQSQKAKREIFELDSAEELKTGVVANMVGVVAFLLEKYNYNAIISLENLCRAYRFATDGLTGDVLASTAVDEDMTFKVQENLVLAGLGTYQFFEMQLLRKLFRIQEEKKIYHLVPAFRSVDNYEMIRKLTKKDNLEFICKPFGIVHFVDPRNTSKKCPVCKTDAIQRESHKDDAIHCETCGFQTAEEIFRQKNIELFNRYKKQGVHLEFIHNGDENGAYNIALKTITNLKQIKRKTDNG